MEKKQLTVSIESIRLDALQYFLEAKEHTTPQAEMEKMISDLYEKYVPAETRAYLESKIKAPAAPKARPKRPASKPAAQTVEPMVQESSEEME